jgi:hypothetical protein
MRTFNGRIRCDRLLYGILGGFGSLIVAWLSTAYGQSSDTLTRPEIFRVNVTCSEYLSSHYDHTHITAALSGMVSNAAGKGDRSRPFDVIVNEARRRSNLGSLSRKEKMTTADIGRHVLEAMCASGQK